jgi:hypothetical protein
VPRRTLPSFVVLAAYSAVSFLYFGIPLVSHPGRDFVGGPTAGNDSMIFIWGFAWYPHAILSWTNPFITNVIYHPQGIDLMWTATVPGLAVIFAPLTLLFGPVVSFNVAALLLPALAAWTCFLLCRYVTDSIWASLVGGYLFGFSSYMLDHELYGHLYLTGVFGIPLIALAVLRNLNGDLAGRGLAWRLGVLIALEYSISTEVTLTLTLVLGMTLVLAYLFMRHIRHRLLLSLRAILGGYALAGLLAAPLLYYTFSGFVGKGFLPPTTGDDLLGFELPSVIAAGGSWLPSLTGPFPNNALESYLGLPAILVIGLYAYRARHSTTGRFFVTTLGLVIVLALGSTLRVARHKIMSLPWSIPAHWAPFNSVETSRFTMYVSLLTAVIVALWTSSTRGRIFSRPVLLPMLAVAALIPAVWNVSFHQRPDRYAFFTQGLYKSYVPRNETLAIFPFKTNSMLWQAESGFWFKLADGQLTAQTVEPKFFDDPVVAELQNNQPDAIPTMTQLLAYARRHDVDRFVSVIERNYPDRNQMRALSALQATGDVLLSPAGGYPSLTGDMRLVTPGQVDLGTEAALTAVLESQRSLERAKALTDKGAGITAAETLLAHTSATLKILKSWNTTAADLANAADDVARASTALGKATSAQAQSAARTRAREWIDQGNRSLGRYLVTINLG